MSTAAQIIANQQNAQYSTGPVTAEGKAASSLNNLQNGFRSTAVLLPTDDPAEYEALFEELAEHFALQDLTDERFIREMASAEWRLLRTRTLMYAALATRMNAIRPEQPDATPNDLEAAAIATIGTEGSGAASCSWSTWLRYETRYERQYDRAYKGWAQYNKDKNRYTAQHAHTQMKMALFAPLPQPPVPAAQIASTVQNSTNTPRQSASTVQTPAAQPLPAPKSAPQIARSAPCPCRSGEKYKRCCGKDAPPLLGKAA